jgi:ABC-type glycerol-3-phosphate transport system permease component
VINAQILLHMVLEGIGGVITAYALARCKHWWHRAIRWVILAYIFSLATVHLVG